MSNTDKNKDSRTLSFIDRIEGDKIVWMIVFLLTMISALAIFSSTSQLTSGSKDRIDLIRSHGIFIIIGYLCIFGIYKIKSISWFRKASKWGFGLSFILLVLIAFNIDLGILTPVEMNNATRILDFCGLFQIHVFEVVKVAMVMYLAWALSAYKQDQNKNKTKETKDFSWLRHIAKNKKFSFLENALWKRIIYIYFPVASITALSMPGSNSSMIFIGFISIMILWIGQMPLKELALIVCIGIVGIFLCIGINQISDGKLLGKFRISTLVGRFKADYNIDRLIEVENDPQHGYHSKEWYHVRDKIKQPYTAKIAIHEGGLFGKGVGKSTQKYVVTHIYSDYMFSFLVEEYGILLGAIPILILYLSLLARGSTIARLCPSEFSRLAVGGLSFMITAQAFMHIFVNVGIGPMTGQTLPLISDGSFAFVMFSIAFGIILSISRIARNMIKKEEENATPIYEKQENCGDAQNQ